MRPCSSGNSPTMSDTRSALARRAARSAKSGSAPTRGARSRASAATRLTRSPCVPSFSWNTTASSRGKRSMSRTRRSFSQKNLASDSRARTTRSLPATTAVPPSLATMLLTSRKQLLSAASPGRRTTKHFWLARMVARITSGGMSRKPSSNRPISTTGHSTRPATSSSRPSSSTISSPCAKARSRASWRMMALRRSASRTTKAFSSAGA